MDPLSPADLYVDDLKSLISRDFIHGKVRREGVC